MQQDEMWNYLWWLANQARQDPIYREHPRTTPDIDTRFFEFFKFVLEHASHAYGQLFQDLWVLWELRQKRDGYFVEFGAADGKTCSNTYLLEKGYGWRGIVAEPNPAAHEQLSLHRNCDVSFKCVYTESGVQLPFLSCDVPELSTISTVDPADYFADIRQNHTEVMVESITLEDLLREYGAPPLIDYLSIDTEGSELDILASHDFGKYRFKLISVEHNSTFRREPIRELLEKHLYTRIFEGYSLFDDWYVSIAEGDG
jgi:FkbM family methyltransferase